MVSSMATAFGFLLSALISSALGSFYSIILWGRRVSFFCYALLALGCFVIASSFWLALCSSEDYYTGRVGLVI